MNEAMFDELLASVEEIDAIKAGDKKPSRVFHYDVPQVKAIREKTAYAKSIRLDGGR